MSAISIFCLVITLVAYVLVKKLYRKFPYLILSPAILVPIVLITILLSAHVSYDAYMLDSQWIIWMLGLQLLPLQSQFLNIAKSLKNISFQFLWVWLLVCLLE